MASTCRIVAKRNPFDDDLIEAEAPVGFRLAEILSTDGHYHAESNGELIDWQTYEIRDTDELVTVIGLPGAPAAISQALFAIGYALGSSAIGYAIGSAILFAATYGAYIAAAVSLVTVATMDTPSVPQTGVPERLNSLTGTKNKFAPYAPVPVLYGERRFYPPLAAQPYTELVGQDQYLNMLLMVSLGEVECSDSMIGEAAANSFDAIEISSHYPTAPGWPVVTDTQVAVQLDDEDWIGTPTTTYTATSDPNAAALAIDFDFPVGLMYTNSKGERRAVKIHFNVEFRLAGSADPWINVRSLDWRATTKGTNETLDDADGVPTTPGVGAIVASTRTSLTAVGNISSKTGSGAYRTITVPTGYTTSSGAPYEIKVNLSLTRSIMCPATPGTIGAGCTTWIVSNTYARHLSAGMAAKISATSSGQFMVAQRFGESFRAGLKWPTPAPGSYEVRVTRTFLNQTDDFTNNAVLLAPGTIEYEVAKYQQIMVWATLHTYTNIEAVVLPDNIPATFLKVRVKTTDQLNGTLDTLSILGKRKLRYWNGSAFAGPTLTRSPAWAFLDMVMNPGVNQRGVTEANAAAQIDLAGLKAWHDGTITTEGFNYDEVVDYPVSVYNGLRRAAGVAWAGHSIKDGKVTVIEDKYNTPTQMFTPRNSRNFQATKSFAELPHALKVQFDSEDADNKTDQIVVYDDGYNSTGLSGTATGRQVNHVGTYSIGTTTIAVDSGSGTIIVGDSIRFAGDPHTYRVATALSAGSMAIAAPGLVQTLADNVAITVVPKAVATKFESLRLPGIVNEDHAWKMGRRMIALAKLRPETYSIEVSNEHVVAQRGDSVSLSHDVTLWGMGAARITAKAVDTPTAGTTTVTLDETILTASDTYALRVRRTTATPAVFDEVTAVPVIASNYNTQWKVTNAQAANWTAGDLVAVGIQDSVTQKAKVLAIRPKGNLAATLTLADDTSASATDGVYGAHLWTIPEYTPNVTLPTDPSVIRPGKPTITDARSDANMAIINPDGSRTVIVSVLYEFGSDTDKFSAQSAGLRYAIAPEDEEEPVWSATWKEVADGAISVRGLEVGLTYIFTVAVAINNRVSAWSDTFEYVVGAMSPAAEPFETLTVNGRPGGFEVIVGFPSLENIGVDYFEILYATANDRADISAKSHLFRPVSDLGAADSVTTFVQVPTPITTHWFWVRWVDTLGNPSEWLPSGATSGTPATNTRVPGNPLGPAVNEDPWFQDAIVGAAGDFSRPWAHASGSSGAVIATITDGVAGNTCLESNTATEKTVLSSINQVVDRSKTYAVRARIRSQSSCDYGAALVVSFYDSSGAQINAYISGTPGWADLGVFHLAYVDDPIPSTFTQVSATFGALGTGTIPSNAKTMRVGVIFHMASSGSVTGKQQVQDLRIDEVIGSVLIEDNAITADKLVADLVLASLIRTLGSGNRVELEGGHDFPFWIGSGTKGATSGSPGSGAKVYYDADLDRFVVSGVLVGSKIGNVSGGRVFCGESASGYNVTLAAWACISSTTGETSLSTSWTTVISGEVLRHPSYSSGPSNVRLKTISQAILLSAAFTARHSATANVEWRIQVSLDGGSWGDLPFVGSLFYGDFSLGDFGGGGFSNARDYSLGTTSWSSSAQFRLEARGSVSGVVVESPLLNYYIQNFGDDGSES